MITPKSKISRENFRKMVAGGKSYLPTKITKELKAAGFHTVLSGSRVGREKALKAIKHLQGKGLLTKLKSPSVLFRAAGISQAEEDFAAEQAIKQKHIRTQIKMDVAEEMINDERGKNDNQYDHRSILGKSVIDELDAEGHNRNQKISDERQKSNKPSATKSGKINRPQLADISNLPDMDIG
ncbi:MAG: hypothetical protein PHW95_04165 [Patescibacteria group bacterium]|nr:hypothetical protein [Patescibacteria group bacterium]